MWKKAKELFFKFLVAASSGIAIGLVMFHFTETNLQAKEIKKDYDEKMDRSEFIEYKEEERRIRQREYEDLRKLIKENRDTNYKIYDYLLNTKTR